jgi:hypothetical protein
MFIVNLLSNFNNCTGGNSNLNGNSHVLFGNTIIKYITINHSKRNSKAFAKRRE